MRPSRLAAFLLVVLLAGAAWSWLRHDGAAAAESARHPAGEYPGDPSLAPVDVVRAYVRAIDKHDGERFCSLIAPWISGEYDLGSRDPDGFFRDIGDCPGFVSSYIGYVEDCCVEVVRRVHVERAKPFAEVDGLTRVDVRIRALLDDGGARRLRRLRDRVWLTRVEDGSWRVAKLSVIAHKASLWMGEDDHPLAAPDLARARAEFATDVERFEAALRAREATFMPVGEAASCAGGVSIADPAHDLVWNGQPLRERPPRLFGVDIRRVRVRAQPGHVCVRWQFVGAPTDDLYTTYSHRGIGRGDQLDQSFDVQLRSDGTARVTTGVDDDYRPIVAPARIGHTGRFVSIELDRESFVTGRDRAARIPWRRFRFQVDSLAVAHRRHGVRDDVGGNEGSFFDYPSGRRSRLP